MPINARVYAGNVYYFNPHLNYGLKARLRRGNGMVDLRGMSNLSYDDLVRLDKLYPDGVPLLSKVSLIFLMLQPKEEMENL